MSDNAFTHVMSPIRVGSHILKNRIISGPSGIPSLSNGNPWPSEAEIHYFEKRAEAGAALVTCAGVSTGAPIGGMRDIGWDLLDNMCRKAIADLSERIHFYGAKASMELLGMFPNGYAVSDGVRMMGGRIGKEIPVSAMNDFKQGFIERAYQLRELNYDAILLHLGHSVPLAQFLSPLTNKRKDEYGGLLENRMRFPLELLSGIRDAVGPDMLIEVRISGSECVSGGLEIDDSIMIGKALQEWADLLQVSAGMHHPLTMMVCHPGGFLPPLPNVRFAEAIKKSKAVNIPISTVGGIHSLVDAEQIIADGRADAVVMARPFIADIELIKKSISGHATDVRPCVKCMRCHDSCIFGNHMQCTVNPVVGIDSIVERTPVKAPIKKKVAIIGGGPAGMQAAITAASRGHDVSIIEKDTGLGGSMRYAVIAPFKYPLKGFLDYLIGQIERLKIDVRLSTIVEPKDLIGKYDAVIVAIGATPVVPGIMGMDNAILASEAYMDLSKVGHHAGIIGGGEVGCELAIYLAQCGKDVSIFEMNDELAVTASPTAHDEILLRISEYPGIEVLTGVKCKKIHSGSIDCESSHGLQTISVDTFINATGFMPKRNEIDRYLNCGLELIPVGDCVKPRSVEWAIKDGYYAGMQL